MKNIKLINGKCAIVDDEDYPYISRFSWNSGDKKMKSHSAYMMVKSGKKTMSVPMQYFLIKSVQGSVIMHKNLNSLDNRKENLIIVKKDALQHHNPKMNTRKGTSKYKGVHWAKDWKKWRANIKKGEKTFYLGHFVREEDAAKAYNKKAQEIYGELAYQNII